MTYNKFYIFFNKLYYITMNTEDVQHPPQNFLAESENIREGMLKTLEFQSLP